MGKSTLITDLLKNQNALIVNFYENATLPPKIDAVKKFSELEKLLLREIGFKPSTGQTLVIDEAQESEQLGRWVRFIKEKWPHQNVIILGSVLSKLFSEDLPYPVGRVQEIVLRPFSFKEFLIATHKPALIEILEAASLENPLEDADRLALAEMYLDYLRMGGMPAVVLGQEEEKIDVRTSWNRLLAQYAADVERYLKENYRSLFLSGVGRIADLACQPVKNSQIVSTDSPFYRKVPLFLEIMQKWHLVFKAAAQTKHPESSGGIASKRYLFDVGMTSFLIHQNQPVSWRDRSELQNIIYAKLQETFVCQEILALEPEPQMDLNYYRETKNSQEIDFLVPLNGKIIPIEVKSQTSFSKNSLMPMLDFLDHRGLNCGIWVYNGEMRTQRFRGKTIHFIPPFFISELPRVITP